MTPSPHPRSVAKKQVGNKGLTSTCPGFYDDGTLKYCRIFRYPRRRAADGPAAQTAHAHDTLPIRPVIRR
jgi:hypothetical protein